MFTVVIYGFEGKYIGNSEYEYRNPKHGETHKCLLFLAQVNDEGIYEDALVECSRYGFAEVVFQGHGELQAEVLDAGRYREFSEPYEEAKRMGRALVYYPAS